MDLLFISIILLILSAIVLKLAGNRESVVISFIKIGTPILSFLLAIFPLINALLNLRIEPLIFPWKFFWGSFYLELDSLSAFFLFPILILAVNAAVYGHEYLKKHRNIYNQGTVWFSFNILIASMMLLVMAKNAVLFLIAWEVMSLSSFFLVISEKEKSENKKAGWLYLCVAHIGAVFLFVFFFIIGGNSGSLDFINFKMDSNSGLASICFLLALIGFGSKAGIIPLHIWLPEAHPAAPSHISALMSGVMIKTGIYGIVRTLSLLPTPPAWWGITLIIIGAATGLFGVLFAIAQHDIKRLLAYHSVENIGIILIGMGLGIYGISINSPFVSIVGFAGGLLHVLNHAFFKGLLFFGAGSVINATGTRDIDKLGGLIKYLPVTAFTFLIGSLAISGIPPLNGFVSEFLIYSGALNGLSNFLSWQLIPFIIAIISLAGIGGLALACFTKVFGIVFLGGPRHKHAAAITESPRAILYPMIFLSILCLFIGLFSLFVIPCTAGSIAVITGLQSSLIDNTISDLAAPLFNITIISASLLLLIVLLFFLKKILRRSRKVSQTVTWDCGYSRPSFKMQYTGSSFAQPITHLFQPILDTQKAIEPLQKYFPLRSKIQTKTYDTLIKYMYQPFYAYIKRIFNQFLRMQHGSTHIYILYILITLIILLLWMLN